MNFIFPQIRWMDCLNGSHLLRRQRCPEHVAMTLSTVSGEGQPSSRVVYFKGFSAASEVSPITGASAARVARCPRFFTNYESQKSREMDETGLVSLLFYWPVQWRQVRIEGRVEKTSYAESDEYFQSRARGSRIGAWASPQSHVIESRASLEERVADVEAKFAGQEIACPPFWGGWRVLPTRVEFWLGGDSRLHDREVFEWTGTEWMRYRVAP